MSDGIIPCPACPDFLVGAHGHLYVCAKCGCSGDLLTLYGDLSERRKADREKMLQIMVRLCERIGVPHEIEREFLGNPRAVAIGIRGPTGLCATIDFDGKSCQPDIFVVSWHMRTDRNSHAIIRLEFCHARNEYHKRKATHVFYGFPAMLQGMVRPLQRIADGTATQEGPEYDASTRSSRLLP